MPPIRRYPLKQDTGGGIPVPLERVTTVTTYRTCNHDRIADTFQKTIAPSSGQQTVDIRTPPADPETTGTSPFCTFLRQDVPLTRTAHLPEKGIRRSAIAPARRSPIPAGQPTCLSWPLRRPRYRHYVSSIAFSAKNTGTGRPTCAISHRIRYTGRHRQPYHACPGRPPIRSQNMENNRPENGKVWFITGASRGFGLEITKLLLEKGHRVAATTRQLDRLERTIGRENDRFLPLQTDLVNEASVKNVLTETVGKFGRLDVVVNNAGYGQFGYVEEISDTLVRREFDVNFFGTLNVIRHALPFMRRQGSGHIFNLSSMAGFTGFPGSGIYCASKFAVAGLSESLRDELADFGIRVTCVKPGNFRTDFLADSMQFEDTAIPEYTEKREAFHMLLKKMNRQPIGDPVRGADIILSVSEMADPPPAPLPRPRRLQGRRPADPETPGRHEQYRTGRHRHELSGIKAVFPRHTRRGRGNGRQLSAAPPICYNTPVSCRPVSAAAHFVYVTNRSPPCRNRHCRSYSVFFFR